jgi:transcriptional regulator with XRE-family HTH domain
MGDRRIAELAGVPRNSIKEILSGRPGRAPAEKLLGRNAEAILAVEPDPAPGTNVTACGTVRRLRALVAIGYTQSYLCERLGVLPGNGCRIFRGEQDFVTAATAHRVTELFTELSMTPGPSQRSRNHARKNRWAPPLAWDDDLIDDPNATPDLGQREKVTFTDRYLELRELGYRDYQIAQRWGIQQESLLRQLDRHGVTA